jgi:hypothetical protein
VLNEQIQVAQFFADLFFTKVSTASLDLVSISFATQLPTQRDSVTNLATVPVVL